MSEVTTGAATLTAEPTPAPAPAPAPAPSPSATPTPNPAPATGEAKWWQSFSDETMRGYAETKNFPSPEEAVRSYANLEKLLGTKANAVMIPGEGATPEEQAAFFEKIGRPGAPENYPVPDALKEDALIKGFAGEAHKLGITSKQFEGVMGFISAQQQATVEATNAQRDAAAAADMDALKKDLPGLKYDALLEHGRRAVRTLGLDQPVLDKLEGALGTRGMLELMGKIGAGSAESPFIEGAPSGTAPSPEAARLEYASLSKDQAFMKKWMSGDTDAVARVNRLNAAMAGVKQ
jgi:hypothetical protein